MLLRASCREGSQGRTGTLANLPSWAPERIEALRRTLTGECDGLSGALPPTCGPICAVLGVLKQLADRLGLTGVLGTERLATLARCLVLVRGAAQGSRLSAVRWAAKHAVAEPRGLGHCDADALSAAVDALAPRQAQSAETLSRVSRRQPGQSPPVVLSEVPASSCEGEGNARAACGDNRDKTAGTAQRVLGWMTTGHGAPGAVHVFDGTTSAPLTVPAQVETLRTRFGLLEVVCVGDRGMSTSTGKTVLATAGEQDITALTTPQVRTLLRAGVVRPEWCPSHGHAGQHGLVRLVLRRSEAVRRTAHRRRADTLATLHALSTARHACVRTAQRAQPAAGLRTLHAWVTRYTLAGWVQWSLQEGAIIATVDAAAQTEASGFDGCSVLETDVPQTVVEAPAVHDRSRDVHEVAQDFRTMKTGLLEVRPLVVRKAPRPRAPVLVTMFALHVVREMRRALVTAFGTTADDTMAVTVDDALAAFSRRCVLLSQGRGTAITRLPSPDARPAAMLNA